MKHTCLALAVLAASTGFAASANAQGRDDPRFGDAGQIAVSAERMFGAMFIWDDFEGGGVDETTSNFHISALSNPLANVTTNYSFPRMGFDFFIADGLSIGAALGYAYTTFDDDNPALVPGDNVWAFLAAPRVGYALSVGEGFGIWPRVGVTWIWATNNITDDTSEDADRFALTAEVPFVISVVEHFAFLIGPTLDLGIAGSNTLEAPAGETEIDINTTELGIQVGIMGYF